jgi:hypothetical protein
MKRSFGKNEATHFREEQKFWGVNQNGYQLSVSCHTADPDGSLPERRALFFTRRKSHAVRVQK